MYGIKPTGEEYPKKTQVFSKQEEQIAFVNGLKAADAEKDWKELYKPIDLNDTPQVHTDSDELERQWDLWYEAELRALAEVMFDMEAEDFDNNEYMSNHKCSTM